MVQNGCGMFSIQQLQRTSISRNMMKKIATVIVVGMISNGNEELVLIIDHKVI